MEEISELKPSLLFPQLQNVFVTRMIISYMEPNELLAVLSVVCKGGRAAALDCSIWRNLIYGKPYYGLSYDCEDYFPCFLKHLQRG